MSNEISVSARLGVLNGNVDISKNYSNIRLDQTNEGAGQPGTISVTGSQTVDFGDLTNPGYMICQNLDTSGNEYISCTVTMHLYPNEIALFPIGSGESVTLNVSAGTGKFFGLATER